MLYRTLGRTGLKISEIGMGTWQLANDENCWVGSDLKESLAALYKFTELGGNYIDTAWSYGYFDTDPEHHHGSEELIGKFLKDSGLRNKTVVSTKMVPKNWKWPARYGIPISEVFPADHITRCVEDSLKSLQTDYIDLMQFHVWNDEWVNIDEWKQTLTKIKESGKVRFWGISNNNYQPSNGLKAADTGLIDSIQFIFNIFHQKPTEKLLPYAKEHNLGLIARVPLDEGGLTGNLTKDTVFNEGDFRKSYFAPERLTELDVRVTKLKTLLGPEAETLPELALRYLLSFDEVSAVIPGIRKVKYAQENAALSDGKKLSEKLMVELKNHSWERNFYATSFSPTL